MSADFTIAAFVALLAVMGAWKGISRQLGGLGGVVIAVAAAPFLGRFLTPHVAQLLGLSGLVAQLVATAGSFLLVQLAVGAALTAGFSRLFEDKENPRNRDTERWLGAGMGALKGALIAYVLLAALVYAEEHVRIGGKRLSLLPADSLAGQLVRRANILEVVRVGDRLQLSRVVKLFDLASRRDPQAWAEDPGLKALQADPRMRRALEDPKLVRAAEAGDYRALLENPAIRELLQDEKLARQLAGAGP